MRYEKQWHDCPCGESIAVSEPEFGKIILAEFGKIMPAEWLKAHAKHATTDRLICDHGAYYVNDAGTRVCLVCGHSDRTIHHEEENND